MSQETPPQDSPQETTRRVENIARLGTVLAVRHASPARCRVKLGDNTTDWIPWFTCRAGGKQGSMWWAPVVGEQCMVLSPGGDLAQGVALLGLYSDKKPQGASEAGMFRMDWSSDDYMQHNTEGSQLKINCFGSITLNVQGNTVEVTPQFIRLAANGGELIVDERGVTATPDVTSMGVSLVKHVHGGVRTGTAFTGPAT